MTHAKDSLAFTLCTGRILRTFHTQCLSSLYCTEGVLTTIDMTTILDSPALWLGCMLAKTLYGSGDFLIA